MIQLYAGSDMNLPVPHALGPTSLKLNPIVKKLFLATEVLSSIPMHLYTVNQTRDVYWKSKK